MSYLSVPYTCPYIDDMQEQLDHARHDIREEIKSLETDGIETGRLEEALQHIMAAYSFGEDLRSMNAALREEGEGAATAAIEFEKEVETWQDIANQGAERVERAEAKLRLFDAEKEEEWLGYLPAPRNLRTG